VRDPTGRRTATIENGGGGALIFRDPTGRRTGTWERH
jgi:hypothetical protein